MNAFFSNPERLEQLEAVGKSWIGTPFVKGGRIKGAGADCIHFVAEALRECGQLPSYTFPAYRIDGGDHLQASLVEQWLRSHPLFVEVPLLEPKQAGDVLEFKIGKGVSHHVGLLAPGTQQRLWSSLNSDGVQVRVLRDSTWGRRLFRVWRPLEGQL